jgi:hypothetical protein
MRIFLAVKRPGMTFYAQHGPSQEMTEDDFLNLPETQQTIANAQHFGDKIRLMQENPDPKGANWLLRELV